MFELEAEKIEAMYKLQDKLNCDTNGDGWASLGITKEGREINWLRCIFMEAVEALDSLNWKHWKDIHGADDIANLKVELVDIWHFIMSEHIVREGVDAAIIEARSAIAYVAQEPSDYIEGADKLFFLEELLKTSVNGGFPLREFLQAVRHVQDFNMEDVYRLYIGKNCLNQFRQNHGYKDGTYIKLWKGKEDNVYMQAALADNPDLDFDGLYAKLEILYSDLVN